MVKKPTKKTNKAIFNSPAQMKKIFLALINPKTRSRQTKEERRIFNSPTQMKKMFLALMRGKK